MRCLKMPLYEEVIYHMQVLHVPFSSRSPLPHLTVWPYNVSGKETQDCVTFTSS